MIKRSEVVSQKDRSINLRLTDLCRNELMQLSVSLAPPTLLKGRRVGGNDPV